MRKIFCFALLLLLLGGCADSSNGGYTDVNLEFVRACSGEYQQVRIECVAHTAEVEETYTMDSILQQEVTNAKALAELGEQISARIGCVTQPPVEFAETTYLWQALAALVQENPEAACYTLWVQHSLEPGYKFAITFVIDGADTPQAAFLEVGRNKLWYTFDSPEKLIEKFWIPTK